MSALVPCPACSRHVRTAEPACPFCGGALPSNLASRAVPAASRRLERLAAFTFAATLAVTGCAVEGSEEDEGSQESEIGSIMPMYGLPPFTDAGSPDSGVSDGGPAPDAHVDGGAVDAGPPVHHDGGLVHVDAGPPVHHDGGGIVPMYGHPPAND